MKHIQEILQELKRSGKFQPEVVINNLNKKISPLETESLVFAVLTNKSKNYEPAVYISEIIGDVVSKYQEQTGNLIELRDTAFILNSLLEIITNDPFRSSKITYLYLEAFETTDFSEAVEHYLHYKNIINNSEETL